MSKLKIKYIRSTGQFEFTEDSIDPRYCDMVACLDTTGETLEFSNLSYGITIKNGETVLGEKTFPKEGVSILRSDQPCLDLYRVQWEADMVVDIDVWMEQTAGRVEGSHQLTVPRPPQPYPSWTWDTVDKVWIAPVPYPDDDKDYYWDEPTLAWKEI